MKPFKQSGKSGLAVLLVICFMLCGKMVSADTEIPLFPKWEHYATSQELAAYSPAKRDIIRKQWFKENVESLPEFRVLSEQNKIALFKRFIDKSIAIEEYASDPSSLIYQRRAAEQGYAEAQYKLGLMYHKGKDVPRDDKEAVRWYRMAAEQGLAEAQYILGLKFENGTGVLQDYQQAVYWSTKAAEQRHAKAQYNLGWMYVRGQGVPKDYQKAIYWYTKAAEQGDTLAQLSLGLIYYDGEGRPQNYKYAYVWSSLAVSNGDEVAKKIGRDMRDQSENKLTPHMLSEAQELATKIQYKIDHQAKSSMSEPDTPNKTVLNEPETKGFGSGFIISKDGYVLTCYHVINDSQIIKVKIGDNLHPAKLVYKDSNNDLALLKVSGTFTALAFSSNRTAKMGQEVFTIGYPNPILQGVNEKLTKGSINSLTGFQDDIRLYQISIPIQPGNSGGPLLDMNGNVIGIVVAMLDANTAFKVSGSLPQNVNYAIKSTYAQALLDTMTKVSGSSLLPKFKKETFDNVVERVKKSVVMIVVYE